jgi:hypothetical protein
MLYIMHRTQLYLDDDLYTTLKARAKKDGTTISELVRTAARSNYINETEKRQAAAQTFFGIRADRPEFNDVDAYIRDLRRGDRRPVMLSE